MLGPLSPFWLLTRLCCCFYLSLCRQPLCGSSPAQIRCWMHRVSWLQINTSRRRMQDLPCRCSGQNTFPPGRLFLLRRRNRNPSDLASPRHDRKWVLNFLGACTVCLSGHFYTRGSIKGHLSTTHPPPPTPHCRRGRNRAYGF